MNDKVFVTEKDDGNVLEILGKDGILRIAVWLGYRIKSIKHYEVFCPICEEDTNVLTRNLSFTSPKGHLINNKLPCLCTERTRKLLSYGIDEFLNSKFKTPRGGYLSVISKDKSKTNNYFVVCSYCMSPKEYQDVFKIPISINRRDLVQGNIPCGCSSRRDFILKRKGIDEFIGSKHFKGRITILDSCADNTDYYEIYCKICSKDKELYPKIISSKSHIKQGKIPCGCSKSPRLSNNQKEIIIGRIAKEEGYKSSTLIKRDDGLFVKIICGKGHSSDTISYYSFVNFGTRCPSCAKTGYDSNKTGVLYISRWYGFGESYLKFGITNNTHKDRYKKQMAKSKLDHEAITSFSGDGSLVLDCEKKIKFYLSTRACPKDWLPDGYTETVEDTKENLEKILKIVEECGLK